MEIPEGLMRLLAKNCDEQNYGLAMMRNEAGITILLMGPKPIGAGLAALSAASMILNDVITGLVNQQRPSQEHQQMELDLQPESKPN